MLCSYNIITALMIIPSLAAACFSVLQAGDKATVHIKINIIVREQLYFVGGGAVGSIPYVH